ncbi:MAG: GAF domain-containing protein [Chloroflexaceae bacterium]|nr:GAF domain-containing protein [Chloroflexaceae bacterium]
MYMDMTTVLPKTQVWEMMTQLAHCGDDVDQIPTVHALLERIVQVLVTVMPHRWGVLTLVEHHQVYAYASWGISENDIANLFNEVHTQPDGYGQETFAVAKTHIRLDIVSGTTLTGSLLLARSSDQQSLLEPSFAHALTTQISLLLQAYTQHALDRLTDILPQLAQAFRSTIALTSFCQLALEQLNRILHYDQAAVLLHRRASTAVPPDVFDADGGLIATYGQSINSEDVSVIRALMQASYDNNDDPWPHTDDTSELVPVQGWLIARLLYQDEYTVDGPTVIGVLAFRSGMPVISPHTGLKIATTVADVVAQAIATRMSQALSKEQVEQLKLLHQRASIIHSASDIAKSLWSDQSIDHMLEQIGYGAMALTEFRQIIFYLVNIDDMHTVDEPSLYVATSIGLTPDDTQHIAHASIPRPLVVQYLNPRFRVGRGFYITTQDALLIEEGFDTTLFMVYPDIDDTSSETWQRYDKLFLPLRSSEGYLFGLMAVGNPRDRQVPTGDTIEALEIMAEHATIAIENYYLLQTARSQTEQMNALYQLGTAITSTTDLTLLFEQVYHLIVHYVKPRASSLTMQRSTTGVGAKVQPQQSREAEPHDPGLIIATYQPQREQIVYNLVMDAEGLTGALHQTVAPKAGTIGWMIDQRQSLLFYRQSWCIENGDVIDPQSSMLPLPEPSTPFASWFGMPLYHQHRVLGVLIVHHPTPDIFSERDKQFFTALTHQLALAIENVNLFEAHEHRIAELKVINRINQIATSTLDLSAMIDQVYDELVGFLQIDAGSITIYDHEQERIIFSLFDVGDGVRDISTAPRKPLAGSLITHIMQTREPLLLRNDEWRMEHGMWQSGDSPFSVPSVEFPSWMGAPLLVGDHQVVGVITIQSSAPDRYDERELAFISNVASELAMGVQNARLINKASEQVQQLGLLNHFSLAAASALDPERIYQAAVDAMAQAAGVDQARLYVYDRVSNAAICVAEHISFPESRAIMLSLLDNPAIAWLDTHLEPLVSYDVTYDPRLDRMQQLIQKDDIRSMAMIPLVLSGKVIGHVGLDFTSRQMHFGTQKIELCQIIANQMTTVIEKTQLFGQVQANANALQSKVSELSTLLEASSILSSLLHPDAVLQSLMELVVRQLEVASVSLWTIQPNNVLVPEVIEGIPEEELYNLRVPVGQGMTVPFLRQANPSLCVMLSARAITVPQFQSTL